MKVKNIIFSFLLSAFICASAHGQARAPHSLYFMETIPQITQVNPAHQPRANMYVILPINFGIDIASDLAVRDFLQKQGNSYYTLVEKQYQYKELYNSIGKAAMLNGGFDADLFGFGFRTLNGYFSFGVSQHTAYKFAMPKAFFEILDEGFPSKTFDFSPLRLQAKSFMQFSIGYSRKINDKLTVGINVKPLFGQIAATTRFKELELRTGLSEWSFRGEGDVYLSAPEIITKIDIDAEEDKIESKNIFDEKYGPKPQNSEYINHYMFKNPGIAFDFGAVYQIDERLSVSAALNNIGFISWNQDLSRMKYKGGFTFDAEDITISPPEQKIGDIGDKIAEKFEDGILEDLSLSDDNKFKTSPTPVLYVGALYELIPGISTGLTSRTTFWQNGLRQSFNLSLYLQPYSFFALNTGATWQLRGNAYLGGGFMFLLGPLQLYLLADYIPLNYSTITIDDDKWGEYIPEKQKTLTYRLGLNLIFGRHGYVNKPMLNKGVSSWN